MGAVQTTPGVENVPAGGLEKDPDGGLRCLAATPFLNLSGKDSNALWSCTRVRCFALRQRRRAEAPGSKRSGLAKLVRVSALVDSDRVCALLSSAVRPWCLAAVVSSIATTL